MYTVCKYFEELNNEALDRKLIFAVSLNDVEMLWQERIVPTPNQLVICKRSSQNYIVYNGGSVLGAI